MRLGLTSILVLSFAFGLPLAQAQYVEIYRLDNLMKELPDSHVLSSLSSELGVPAETLKQEKTDYKITYGELYLAHQFAKATKADVKSMMPVAQAKTWGTTAKDRKIDMDQIKENTRKFEKTLKRTSAKK